MRKTLPGGLVAVAFGGSAHAQTVPAGPTVPLPSDTIIPAYRVRTN